MKNWLSEEQRSKLTTNSDIAVGSTDFGDTFIHGYDAELEGHPLFEAILDLTPNRLEREIIKAITEDPNLLEDISHVRIYHNPTVPGGYAHPNYYLLAYGTYVEKLPSDFGRTPTRSLIHKLGLEEKFDECNASFTSKGDLKNEAKSKRYDWKHVLSLYTYHQRMLTFSKNS